MWGGNFNIVFSHPSAEPSYRERSFAEPGRAACCQEAEGLEDRHGDGDSSAAWGGKGAASPFLPHIIDNVINIKNIIV